MREEMIKRERNLGCLRRRMGVPWWRRWLVPSRCEWEATGWNAWGVEVESRCNRCGNFRHHRFLDRQGEMIAWRAGRHPKAEEAAGPPHKRITDIIKERGWKPLPVHLREERIPTVSSENTQDQQTGGPCRREPTIKRAKTELSPYWYGLGALLVTPLSAIIFVLMGLMIILAWPLIPFLCYLQKKEEMSKTNTQDQQTGGAAVENQP